MEEIYRIPSEPATSCNYSLGGEIRIAYSGLDEEGIHGSATEVAMKKIDEYAKCVASGAEEPIAPAADAPAVQETMWQIRCYTRTHGRDLPPEERKLELVART